MQLRFFLNAMFLQDLGNHSSLWLPFLYCHDFLEKIGCFSVSFSMFFYSRVVLLNWLPPKQREPGVPCYLTCWGRWDRFMPFPYAWGINWIKQSRIELEPCLKIPLSAPITLVDLHIPKNVNFFLVPGPFRTKVIINFYRFLLGEK